MTSNLTVMEGREARVPLTLYNPAVSEPHPSYSKSSQCDLRRSSRTPNSYTWVITPSDLNFLTRRSAAPRRFGHLCRADDLGNVGQRIS